MDDPFGIRKLREELERLRDPFGIRKLKEEQERLRDPFGTRKLKEEQERLRDPFGIRKFREERLLDLLKPAGLSSIRERQTTLRNLIGTEDLKDRASALTRSLGIAAEGSRLVESALQQANLTESAQLAGLATSALFQFAGQTPPALPQTGVLLEAAEAFFDSPVESSPADLVGEIPSELFRAVDADQAIHSRSADVADEERSKIARSASDELEAILASDHPELVNLLNGARQAALSTNPDRLRHVSISLRELLGIALRKLAPDDTIKEWTNRPDHFHEGKPTRRARFEYIFRSITGASALRSLIDADMRAAKELFDALSTAAHGPALGAPPETLIVLISRAEGTLLLMLRLAVRGK